MAHPILIFGYGAVGAAVTQALSRRGSPVTVAQRHAPAHLPAGAGFTPCDVLDATAVAAAMNGAAQAVIAIGFPYDGGTWRSHWPRAMTNLVETAAETGTRLIFVDNLYMYGPQTVALREDMPLTSAGIKPAVRAEVTRIWQAASAAGRVKFAALRAPDFYGPGVGAQSQLGDLAFGALARGKRAMLIAPPDTPHDFAYVPDFARGVVTLLDAPDDAFGQVWHLPCAPTQTPRRLLALGAQALGVPARISALPLPLLPVLGLFLPIMRELSEMRFQFDRPYRVDARKFAARFWSDPTPFETGAVATALSFRAATPD